MGHARSHEGLVQASAITPNQQPRLASYRRLPLLLADTRSYATSGLDTRGTTKRESTGRASPFSLLANSETRPGNRSVDGPSGGACEPMRVLVQVPPTFASNDVRRPPRRCPAGWTHASTSSGQPLATTVLHLMAGTASGTEVAWIVIAPAAITAVFAPLTTRLYRAIRGTAMTRSSATRTKSRASCATTES